MWRLLVAVVLSLTALGLPAATETADAALAQPAVGSLEADFNADGFVDLAVGAPFEDVGAAQDAGAVSVLYGSAAGLTGAGSQAFWQGSGGAAGTTEAGDQFGAALAAGDFDNDGFADLAVGVASENVGTAQDAGAVSVLYGSAGGLTGAGSQGFWQGTGGAAGTAEAEDQFGAALAAGDFDANGHADLAIGAPFEDVGATVDAGAVSVLYGSAAGLSPGGSQGFWQGSGGAAGSAETADVFALALTAGDFDGDGRGDLAVGVAREDVGAALDAGAVNVLYGSAGGLAAAGSQAFWQGTGGAAGSAEAGDELGWSLAAGDFDGDGRADLAAGAPFENIGATVDPGAISVLYGSAGGLAAAGSQAFWQGTGGAAGAAEAEDEFGWSLAAGDFDNDGPADLAAGAPFERVGTAAAAGAVTVLYGSPGGLASAGSQGFWQGTGGAAGAAEPLDLFGMAAAAGDFDGDSLVDLAAGVPFEDVGATVDAGAVSVLYGSVGGLAAAGSQAFSQGTGGAAGTAEAGDLLGLGLVSGDLSSGASTAAGSRSRVDDEHARQRTRAE
jgi:hypothetical protein